MKTIPKEQMLEVIKRSGGNKTYIAKELNISRTLLEKRLKDDDELRERFSDVREALLDFCEQELIKKVRSGDMKAIMFTLRTIGRSRGYVERSETEVTLPEYNFQFVDEPKPKD